MTHNIAVLPGDGIGPEIVEQAVRVLKALDVPFDIKQARSAAPPSTRSSTRCRPPRSSWPGIARRAVRRRGRLEVRQPAARIPSRAGHPGPAQGAGLFANLRPAILYPELASASSLKPEIVSGLDILIIRELTGDIYFGTPRASASPDGAFAGEREGFDTMRYAESEVRRIARIGFESARKRGKKLCSVDKANVLETSQFWRDR